MRYFSAPSRYICNVFDEMRKCNETKNYSYLLSLIEEAQTLANRMEASLQDLKDLEYLREERKRLKEEIKALDKEKSDKSSS